MKNLPAVFVILIAFAVGAVGLVLYSQMKPTPMPAAQNVWTVIDDTQSQIKDRSISLEVGQAKESVAPPFFKVTTKRLTNLPYQDGTFGRYVSKITVLEKLPKQETFSSGGIEVGFVDKDPDAFTGNVTLVAFRKLETLLQQ